MRAFNYLHLYYHLVHVVKLEKSYWIVEDVFKTMHEEQLKDLGERSTNEQPQQEREIDGKMDRKTFLDYVSRFGVTF